MFAARHSTRYRFILLAIITATEPRARDVTVGNTKLSQQLALIAAGVCLLVTVALVALSTVSSRHMQTQLQAEYGEALAQLISQRVSRAMEAGDLLGVSALLQRFVETSAASGVSLVDIEGKTIGQAGSAPQLEPIQYTAPVKIEADIAGTVHVAIQSTVSEAAQQRLTLSLLGLALLLSLTVYIGARMLGQHFATRLSRMARALRLQDQPSDAQPVNELALLESRVEALPMDLLQTRSEPVPEDENYQTTAVLLLGLSSLADYVETLDEATLQNYIERIHQLVYAAAGFYAGDLQVARQFGLAVYFTDDNSAGSAAFRAASCAWLIKNTASAIEKELSGRAVLSIRFSMALAQSELGIGSASDIYPGLYMQHTLDELAGVCATRPTEIMLSPSIIADVDVSSRTQLRAVPDSDLAVLEAFHGRYADLLERQQLLIVQRLVDPTRLPL